MTHLNSGGASGDTFFSHNRRWGQWSHQSLVCCHQAHHLLNTKNISGLCTARAAWHHVYMHSIHYSIPVLWAVGSKFACFKNTVEICETQKVKSYDWHLNVSFLIHFFFHIFFLYKFFVPLTFGDFLYHAESFYPTRGPGSTWQNYIRFTYKTLLGENMLKASSRTFLILQQLLPIYSGWLCC